jgi:hypothetical protein
VYLLNINSPDPSLATTSLSVFEFARYFIQMELYRICLLGLAYFTSCNISRSIRIVAYVRISFIFFFIVISIYTYNRLSF